MNALARSTALDSLVTLNYRGVQDGDFRIRYMAVTQSYRLLTTAGATI